MILYLINTIRLTLGFLFQKNISEYHLRHFAPDDQPSLGGSFNLIYANPGCPFKQKEAFIGDFDNGKVAHYFFNTFYTGER